jgi:hypothetical protein
LVHHEPCSTRGSFSFPRSLRSKSSVRGVGSGIEQRRQITGESGDLNTRGQTGLAAHGNQEMPVRGSLFWRMGGGHDEEVQLPVANLNHYIESLQVK